MGLRFRKTFSLAPGIRMNLSGGGVSWSLGPRGASIGIGKRGTYFNAGIPGTGLSYRSRLDLPDSTAEQRTVSTTTSVVVEITNDGMIQFKGLSGDELPDATIRQIKRESGGRIRELIQAKCDAINAQVAALGTIHLHTPSPNAIHHFVRQSFDLPEPVPAVLETGGLLAMLFKHIARRISSANQSRLAAHSEAVRKWESEKQRFDESQTVLKQTYFSAVAGVPADMDSLLEKNLQSITWPRETRVAIEISAEGDMVALSVDFPELEHLPDKIASVPQRDFILSVKKMSETELRKLYVRHVHGIGFRIVGEVFSALPTVRRVILSGYSQRGSAITGIISDEYLYSVRVSRDEWKGINFSNLAAIDVTEVFTRFELRRAMSKSGAFKPIVPFTIGEV